MHEFGLSNRDCATQHHHTHSALCSKKFGLPPTGQVKRTAKQHGFDNVHDWLVYQATKEPAADIAARSAAKARREANTSAAQLPSRQASNTMGAFERSASASRPVSAAMRSTAGQAPDDPSKRAAGKGAPAAAAVAAEAAPDDVQAATARPPLPRKATRGRASMKDAAAAPAPDVAAPAAPAHAAPKRRKLSTGKRATLTVADVNKIVEKAAATTPMPASTGPKPSSAGLVHSAAAASIITSISNMLCSTASLQRTMTHYLIAYRRLPIGTLARPCLDCKITCSAMPTWHNRSIGSCALLNALQPLQSNINLVILQASEPSPEQEARLGSKRQLKPRQLHFSPAADPLAGDEMDPCNAQLADNGIDKSPTVPDAQASEHELAAKDSGGNVPEAVFAAFVDALNKRMSYD